MATLQSHGGMGDGIHVKEAREMERASAGAEAGEKIPSGRQKGVQGKIGVRPGYIHVKEDAQERLWTTSGDDFGALLAAILSS